jgi:hypothetical protein
MKARMALFFAAALVAGGLALVLYFAALLAWQVTSLLQAGAWVALPATLLVTDQSLLEAGKAAAVLPYIPEFPLAANASVAAVLERVHVGLAFALVGLVLVAWGLLSASRVIAASREEQLRRADRLRRVAEYRRDDGPAGSIDGRREPFIS